MMSAKTAPPKKTMCFLLDTNREFLKRKKKGGGKCHISAILKEGENREVTMTKDKGHQMYIQTPRVAIEHAREVQLLHFFFELAREAVVYARLA
jgi:hypothetical protein